MPDSVSRLVYRAPVPEDLERLFAIFGDPQTNLFNPAGPMAGIEDARRLLGRWLQQWFGLVRPDHAASIRVLKKIGMQPFGLLDDVPGQAPSLVLRACHPTTASA
ncbi:GCN5-related N-acetyltransferase [Pseudomonas orientalis]|uniref:GNAT family N-acetyltransferase n=1 Tax=Pseudomonas orientalis TaxID=76758 RepID=UPI000F568EAF|nr:GNAT family N-acetyltransferase [Pseudomonas orientalis]AZE84180.1 GCN5-related N-acetyltransferase [Pseudomonas orientalis]